MVVHPCGQGRLRLIKVILLRVWTKAGPKLADAVVHVHYNPGMKSQRMLMKKSLNNYLARLSDENFSRLAGPKFQPTIIFLLKTICEGAGHVC